MRIRSRWYPRRRPGASIARGAAADMHGEASGFRQAIDDRGRPAWGSAHVRNNL